MHTVYKLGRLLAGGGEGIVSLFANGTYCTIYLKDQTTKNPLSPLFAFRTILDAVAFADTLDRGSLRDTTIRLWRAETPEILKWTPNRVPQTAEEFNWSSYWKEYWIYYGFRETFPIEVLRAIRTSPMPMATALCRELTLREDITRPRWSTHRK